MVKTESPLCDFNLPAISFNLKGVDGNYYDLENLKGPNGLLVMFICNHCPYVNSIIFKHEVIGVVQFLAPRNVYFTEVET